MRILVDTQILIWAGQGSSRLSRRASAIFDDPANRIIFSAVSVAEVAIKHALRRPDFPVDPRDFRAALLDNEYEELALYGDHACRLLDLPPIHKDPFDRMLIAQALAEGIVFLTADTTLGGYPGRVTLV